MAITLWTCRKASTNLLLWRWSNITRLGQVFGVRFFRPKKLDLTKNLSLIGYTVYISISRLSYMNILLIWRSFQLLKNYLRFVIEWFASIMRILDMDLSWLYITNYFFLASNRYLKFSLLLLQLVFEDRSRLWSRIVSVLFNSSYFENNLCWEFYYWNEYVYLRRHRNSENAKSML